MDGLQPPFNWALRVSLNNMRPTFIFSLFLYFSNAIACDEIKGTYTSFSETHWNFQLTIDGEKTKLIYKTYWYGDHSLRVDEEIVSEAICSKKADGYTLIFPDRKPIDIEYYESLSYEYFGVSGGSKGIIGVFLPNIKVELWSKLPKHVTSQ